jgi:uncharacterized RDD family membrane protein YckC
MKIVELKTTQNVAIQYELAPLRERIFAFILDWLIKSVGSIVFALIFMEILRIRNEMVTFMVMIVLFLSNIFYSLFFEMVLNGQTPGKKMMKIKVIKLNGKQPTFYDYLLRWSFRIVDIFMTGSLLAILLISSTKFSQRLGDMLANMSVVKLNPSMSIGLKDILRIDSKKSYSPQFPMIKNFREEDIILIKQVLERNKKYNNDAHHDAMVDLANIMASKLEIAPVPSDKVTFLRTLIKDYIVLTR